MITIGVPDLSKIALILCVLIIVGLVYAWYSADQKIKEIWGKYDECSKSKSDLENKVRDLNALLDQRNQENQKLSADLAKCKTDLDNVGTRYLACQKEANQNQNRWQECEKMLTNSMSVETAQCRNELDQCKSLLSQVQAQIQKNKENNNIDTLVKLLPVIAQLLA